MKTTAAATLAATTMALVTALPAPAAAQAYPSQPVTLVAPFAAGGDADIAARNLAAFAQPLLGQPVVVANRAGAGGAVGTHAVGTAAPDGYTLLMARVGSSAVLPALKPNLNYKWNEFTFIGLTELNPFVCVVKGDSAYKTLADLLAAIKANPGKLNYSTSGPGTILNFGAQMLMDAAGLGKDAAVQIPYKGGGEAATAVLTGDAQFSCGNLTSLLGQIRGGGLRALLTTHPERLRDLPDVPTVRELGYPQMEAIVGWSALFGPPGLPPAVVQKWAELLQRASTDAGWIAATEKAGSTPYVRPPQETEAFVRQQVEVYGRLGKLLGIELQ